MAHACTPKGHDSSSKTDLRPNLSGPATVGYVSLVLLTGPGLTPSDSVTRSPLYSIYGETISGVTILRAFGASSKFLRDMLKSVDTVLSHLSFEKSI